ncbi:MAG: glycosyltransferase family 4 protein [Bacteroidales bacterium]|nr:glycosyltransferase family 4 protein [Bacteroidales bacterium]
MKILLLDNSSLTLIGDDYCIEPKTGAFAQELNSLGNEVTIYGQKVNSNNTIHSYKLLENGLKVVGLKRRRNKLWNYILLYFRIIPEIIKADFVYIFYPSSYKYVAIMSWLMRTKYGLYIRGEQGIKNKLSHWIYNKADVVFTVTNQFTSYVNKITSKNHAFSIRPMIPFTEKDVVTDRDYKKIEQFRILSLGRVTDDKGIMELMKAVKLLKDKNYNFELIVVGDGGFMPDTMALIQDLQIDDKVRLIGAVDDSNLVAHYYKTSDIYILPTYHEGFPRTLYEAMIFGTPIITTFVGGIPGLMKDGYNCKEIKPKSVQSIVEGLEYAFNNYGKMIEFAKNGTNTVSRIVDSKRMTHVEHLNKVIKK